MKDLILEFIESSNFVDNKIDRIIDYVNNVEETYYVSVKELISQYCNTSNPVTRWSLRECIISRIFPNRFDIAYGYFFKHELRN